MTDRNRPFVQPNYPEVPVQYPEDAIMQGAALQPNGGLRVAGQRQWLKKPTGNGRWHLFNRKSGSMATVWIFNMNADRFEYCQWSSRAGLGNLITPCCFYKDFCFMAAGDFPAPPIQAEPEKPPVTYPMVHHPMGTRRTALSYDDCVLLVNRDPSQPVVRFDTMEAAGEAGWRLQVAFNLRVEN